MGVPFKDAKKALKALIDSMTDQDTLSIQTLGEGRGTMDFWGAVPTTVAAKVEAKLFADKLVTRC
jgi:hypothetical protein